MWNFSWNYPTDEVDKEKFGNGEKIGEVLTKDWISAKLKIIRADFRKAIDKGKRSGGERVVFTFFDLCEQLWGGNPAFTAIENRIDSQGAYLEESFSSLTSDATNCNDTSIDMSMLTHQENDEIDEENDSEELPLTANDITDNRERTNEFLKNRLEKKLSTRSGNDEQMINIAKEDMLSKRKLISQFEKSDEELNISISKISKTMESIGNAMQECVGIMRGLMMQYSSPYQYFINNQNIQSNTNNVRRSNYNAGYDTASRNFSTFVDERNDVSSNSSSIVNDGIRALLNLFIYIFFTRRFYTHKKHKTHTGEQKQKRQHFYAHKNI